ncbi:hypothetical protein K438DRAFT_1781557 [Mycena galopus ATCC 62051]|nr:hypothetical protein K438DRAFT_1781557 [Mycena galopus ATCC 62051]
MPVDRLCRVFLPSFVPGSSPLGTLNCIHSPLEILTMWKGFDASPTASWTLHSPSEVLVAGSSTVAIDGFSEVPEPVSGNLGTWRAVSAARILPHGPFAAFANHHGLRTPFPSHSLNSRPIPPADSGATVLVLPGLSQAPMKARYHLQDFKGVWDVTQTVKRHWKLSANAPRHAFQENALLTSQFLSRPPASPRIAAASMSVSCRSPESPRISTELHTLHGDPHPTMQWMIGVFVPSARGHHTRFAPPGPFACMRTRYAEEPVQYCCTTANETLYSLRDEIPNNNDSGHLQSGFGM